MKLAAAFVAGCITGAAALAGGVTLMLAYDFGRDLQRRRP